MRYDVAASTNSRVRPTRIFHSQRMSHVKIQVFDPVTVFVSKREMDLQAVDAAGNSLKGFKLQQGLTELFFVSGELWVTCNQAIQIEADDWPVSWVRL